MRTIADLTCKGGKKDRLFDGEILLVLHEICAHLEGHPVFSNRPNLPLEIQEVIEAYAFIEADEQKAMSPFTVIWATYEAAEVNRRQKEAALELATYFEEEERESIKDTQEFVV